MVEPYNCTCNIHKYTIVVLEKKNTVLGLTHEGKSCKSSGLAI